MDLEAIIDPDLPICDPHHHYWRHDRNPYLLEDLHADTGSGHNVTKTVFVECMAEYSTTGPEALRPVGETTFVAEAAARSEQSEGATIAGIVSFADLSLGAGVAEVLEAHINAGDGRFRGIRHAVSWDPSEDILAAHTRPTEKLMGDDRFREGFATLGEMGLTFDSWMYHPQLPDLVGLVDAVPATTVVLDHLGGPLGIGPYRDQRQAVLETSRTHLAELAARPQVNVKLGGIGMSVYGDAWHKMAQRPSSELVAEVWGEHINWIIDQFGPERCMFESNFPVDKVGIDYPVLWNAFKLMTASRSASEKAWLFHDTACAVYQV